MRPELRFRAGSLTRSLVATAVLGLAAEGRLSLADPLERWLAGLAFLEARLNPILTALNPTPRSL